MNNPLKFIFMTKWKYARWSDMLTAGIKWDIVQRKFGADHPRAKEYRDEFIKWCWVLV